MDWKSTVTLIALSPLGGFGPPLPFTKPPSLWPLFAGAETTAHADYPGELDERHIAERLGTIRLTATALAMAIKNR
jgi:hypothetical protein